MQSLDPQKTVFLIDGSGFLYRAYYGLRPLHTPQGVPIQAVYSFCRMIKKLLNKFNPSSIALVWDSPGRTERHELFSDYKSTRQAPPNDLFDQKKLIQEFADIIHLRQVQRVGIEADDLLFSLAQDYQKISSVVIISSDKDMAQTLSDKIHMFDPFKDTFFEVPALEQSFGFPIHKLPFFYALIGDSSDNIPGVSGIGPKGATALVQQFASLQDLYNNLSLVSKERMRQLLEKSKSDAFLSEELFKLRYHPLNIELSSLHFDKDNWSLALPFFDRLGFHSLIKESQKKEPAVIEEKVPDASLSASKGYQFITIITESELEAVINEIKEHKIVAVDTEGDGLNPLLNELVGISLSTHLGKAYYIPCGHKVDAPQLPRSVVLEKLGPVLTDLHIQKIMHHAKFDQLVLLHYKQSVVPLSFDTLIAAHLVTQDWQSISLKSLSSFYLQEAMLTYAQVVTDRKYKNFSYTPLDIATEYSAADAHQTLQLLPILKDLLLQQNMEQLYYAIELPLVKVLLDMEREGIFLDRTVLRELDVQVTKDLAELKDTIIGLIGHEHKEINLNSPKQLEQLLFVHLQLPKQKKSNKRTGFSTDVEVLKELSKLHLVPALILKYRELFKLKSTYIDALPEYINRETGKIHTSFSQTGVATGRLSSSNPNLQNIPTQSSYNIHIRSAFKPDPGSVFLSADYSQIELRVLAYLSQDQTLIEAFKNHRDIHTQTAAHLFEVPLEGINTEQRQIGKRINFSILYGLTPYGLSKDLGISFKESKLYIDRYFSQYPGVRLWMETVLEETRRHGYVSTLYGRRRYIPGIYEKNKVLYDLACRTAINTVAQGTAAEIMKLGMLALHAAFQERALQSKILLQIHDELLISVPREEQEKVQKLVHEILEHITSWNVPLVIASRFGNNWQEVTK